MEKKKYFSEINIARGIGALLVIVGHAVLNPENGELGSSVMGYIHNFCYSFHMALFFILSGFVARRALMAQDTDVSMQIKKRAQRLLVPYAFYSFVTVILKPMFSSFARRSFDLGQWWQILLGVSPNGGIWYLWSLFVASVLLLLLSRKTKNDLIYICLAAVMYILYMLFPNIIINKLLKYTVFYAIGVWLSGSYDALQPKLKRGGAVLMLLAALLVLSLVHTNQYLYFITALIGSAVVLGVSLFVVDRSNSRLYAFLDEIGNYSYDIYLLSYFVQVPLRVICFDILKIPYSVTAVLMIIGGIIVPYYASKYVIRRSKILGKLLVGKFN